MRLDRCHPDAGTQLNSLLLPLKRDPFDIPPQVLGDLKGPVDRAARQENPVSAFTQITDSICCTHLVAQQISHTHDDGVAGC